MKKTRLFIKIFRPYTVLILVAILIVTFYAGSTIRKFYYDQISLDLETRARLIAYHIEDSNLSIDSDTLNVMAKELGNMFSMRITLIMPDGTVIGDSGQDPSQMDNHLNRPEIQAVLKYQKAKSERYSHTVHKNMMYVAVPIIKDNKIYVIVRTSLPVAFINDIITNMIIKIIILGFIILIITAFISYYFSRQISKPLEELEKAARQISDGNFSTSLPGSNIVELDRFSDSLISMATEINKRINTIETQNYEQEALFSSMNEGIIAVDKNKTIIKMNYAAAKMFKLNLASVRGLNIKEVLKNDDLKNLISKAIELNQEQKSSITLQELEEKYLQVNISLFKNPVNKNIAAIVVFNDITHLRKLETIRRDFVANVSHELKTPVTTIKGFVETLKDGAIKNPDEAAQFLDIIAKHVVRLETIIEDLLALSRIEQEYDNNQISMSYEPLKDILEAAIHDCERQATAKSIKINYHMSENIYANVNPSLMEQALVNLIDNAIKYSNEKSEIKITSCYDDSKIIISVADQGCGIPEKHKERLFERFYRVDKARSRKLGGTGLGLAIVKHILQAHSGFVTVESEIGKGSKFTLWLPR